MQQQAVGDFEHGLVLLLHVEYTPEPYAIGIYRPLQYMSYHPSSSYQGPIKDGQNISQIPSSQVPK